MQGFATAEYLDNCKRHTYVLAILL